MEVLGPLGALGEGAHLELVSVLLMTYKHLAAHGTGTHLLGFETLSSGPRRVVRLFNM